MDTSTMDKHERMIQSLLTQIESEQEMKDFSANLVYFGISYCTKLFFLDTVFQLMMKALSIATGKEVKLFIGEMKSENSDEEQNRIH